MHKRFIMLAFGGICWRLLFINISRWHLSLAFSGVCWSSVAFVVDQYFL